MNKFIFDVDGTLTPSRGIIDPNFAGWFLEFAQNNLVYLVTGSDYPKTVEQLGEPICNAVTTIYNCSGNDVYKQGQNIKTNDWKMNEQQQEWLSSELAQSEFPLRTGLHFEHRPGTVNFSIVGRNANSDERAEYIKWDQKTKERARIARNFTRLFPELTASVGGETGIDIYPTGMDKAQIIQDFNQKTDTLYFFGDKIVKHGNDFSLASLIEHSYNVKDWQDTYNRLLLMKVMGLIL